MLVNVYSAPIAVGKILSEGRLVRRLSASESKYSINHSGSVLIDTVAASDKQAHIDTASPSDSEPSACAILRADYLELTVG